LTKFAPGDPPGAAIFRDPSIFDNFSRLFFFLTEEANDIHNRFVVPVPESAWQPRGPVAEPTFPIIGNLH
jgi:hypothetical protein